MKKIKPRHILLLTLLILVTLVKLIPGFGSVYTFYIYPTTARMLSPIPNLIPFAIGDLFIAASIAWVTVYPIYSIAIKKKKKLPTLLRVAEYLLWIYVWFYAAWGLNYSQPNIYSRLHMRPVEVQDSTFRTFAYRYAYSLNDAYLIANKHSNVAEVSGLRSNQHKQSSKQKTLSNNWMLRRPETSATDKNKIMLITQQAVLHGYTNLKDMGINHPFNPHAHAKTMLFSRLSSMAGITGSMGPFFCEFTLNADVLPHGYPATYAHEYAHFLGIANEGEANFYSYIICTSSNVPIVRFSGYYEIFFHVLRNVRDLLGEAEYKDYLRHIRPEIIYLAENDRKYWLSRHSPIVDSTQNFLYNLYLKGNRVEGGMKSYSGVIGIIMAWEKRESRIY